MFQPESDEYDAGPNATESNSRCQRGRTAGQSNRSAVARAAADNAFANDGRSSNSVTAFAIAPASRAGTSRAFSPSVTSADTPPTSVDTTGRPEASASR